MPLPTLTEEQRKAALEKAAEARRARAEIKEQLKKGTLKLKDILARSGEDVVGKMKVSAVLEALPGVGKVRARKIMERLEISTSSATLSSRSSPPADRGAGVGAGRGARSRSASHGEAVRRLGALGGREGNRRTRRHGAAPTPGALGIRDHTRPEAGRARRG
jgi:hypothetical protein